MKKVIAVIVLISCISYAHAFDWSVNEYITNCSVVHQKTLSEVDREILGYCMGVLKGTLTGIVITSSVEAKKFTMPTCIDTDDAPSSVEVQKNVLATMRLKYSSLEIANEPNTANFAVALALIDLYPCLLE